MAYNAKQGEAALDFLPGADSNVTNENDKKRIQAYDLYENIYINATKTLKIVLRGDDQNPLLVPTGRKIVEATNRFLGVNLGFLVEAGGDEGTREAVQAWWDSFWKREAFVSKFASNKRWGLVRGDACFYISANPNKTIGKRIKVVELDPRTLFEIEDPNDSERTLGYHIVDTVQDFRDPDKLEKKIARRRTFRRVDDEFGETQYITSELGFYELGKWDDRDTASREKMEKIPSQMDEEEFQLPKPINALPVYKWRTRPLQNSSWGTSILAGLETLLYAVNQSISDEDATIVFQGLGMYVTTAAAPIDENGQITDWNIGPKQIIEISGDQRFERVSGLSDVAPFQDHMNWIDQKGISESSGTPEIAIGRVDVAVAESGISLQLQMMPLIAGNAELELEMVNVLDQFFHDITTLWLPAYEQETFGGAQQNEEASDTAIATMSEISVVCLFDDPMPKNRDAEVQEVVLLDSSNLILKSMAVAKLRELGWKYPTVDPFTDEPLDDDDIADMLLEQAKESAAAMDPFSAGLGGGDTGATDEFGNPIEQPETPDNRTIDLGVSA